MPPRKICVNIVKCLEKAWTKEMLFDFTVKIADETIKCHRLILAACSEFFQGLFRSGMREVTENCVVLKDVSCEVFHVITKALYTGEVCLILDNFIEVWHAVHMLRINFMDDLCEKFALSAISIDTWENIYLTANLLSSEIVLEELRNFMLKNFNKIRLSSIFLQLSFKEIKDLIKSQDLVVKNENVVLETVIRWVNHDPPMMGDVKETRKELNFSEKHNKKMCMLMCKTNDSFGLVILEKENRKDKLSKLLKHVRTCLVSPLFLNYLYNMELLSDNKDVREIIFNALPYNMQDFRHGQWPNAGMHRSCSGQANGVVFSHSNESLHFISAYDDKVYDISKCNALQKITQLVNFNGELYIIGKQRTPLHGDRCGMYLLNNSWKYVMDLPCRNSFLLSHGDYMYLLNHDAEKIYWTNPKKEIPEFEIFTSFPSTTANVKHAMCFENFLLLFCTINGIDQTAVHKLHFSSKVWSRVDNLGGPAEHLISFRSDRHNYILQANGSLWLLDSTTYNRNIEFKFLAKLWGQHLGVYGAFTYNQNLTIFGKCRQFDPPENEIVDAIPDHFKIINYWGTDFDNFTNVIPIILPKSYLK